MSGKMIVISAPSGAGKTTIVKHLLGIPELELQFSISACSRSARKGEVEGKDYYFMSVDEFRSKIDEDYFVEWEEVYHNNYYGTLKSEVDRMWGEEKNIIFDLDVAGAMSIKRHYKEKVLSVYIQPPSVDELEKRLRARNLDSEEGIRRRVKKAKYEITYARKFDKIVLNENLETAKKETEQLVREFLKS
jgi:guanylate kinase